MCVCVTTEDAAEVIAAAGAIGPLVEMLRSAVDRVRAKAARALQALACSGAPEPGLQQRHWKSTSHQINSNAPIMRDWHSVAMSWLLVC